MTPTTFDASAGVTETDQYVLFHQGYLSQWYLRDFYVSDGHDFITYNCAEQFMMACKARLFGDATSLHRIMSTRSPKTQKAHGRNVEGFESKQWDTICSDVVTRGNIAKFTQHADLRAALSSTGDKLIAEASPYDTVWGIGVNAQDAIRAGQSKWKGNNLLGKALMTVRKQLRAEANAYKLQPTSQ